MSEYEVNTKVIFSANKQRTANDIKKDIDKMLRTYFQVGPRSKAVKTRLEKVES